MGIKNTGTVNDAATPGAGRGEAIKRDPLDTRPVNPSATIGAGRGYVPVKIGVHATPERRRNNDTKVEITLTPDPVTVSGGGCYGFELTAGGTPSALKVNVSSALIAGQEPSGFTEGSKEFSVSSSGVIYAQITVNSTTGAITGRALNYGSSTPANTATVFHEQIGTYTVTGTGNARAVSVSNSRCGSVYVNICRNWYAATAPFYGVSIS